MLNGKTALVTGASGGIGGAIAVELAKEGASKVLLVGRNRKRLNEIEKEVREAGATAVPIVADLADSVQLNVQFKRAWKNHGPIDLLVNSAGVAHQAPFLRARASHVTEELAVNVLALIEGTRILAQRMAKRGEGIVVNVSSLMGLIPSPSLATYSATKFAVLGFSRALKAELELSGVKVVTLLPTLTETAMVSDIATMPGVTAVTPEEVAKSLIAGLKGNRSEILVGWQARFAAAVKQFFPGVMDFIVRKKAEPLLLEESANARTEAGGSEE